MQIALGRSPADEAKTGLHKLSKASCFFSEFSTPYSNFQTSNMRF
jgi:hypothetical protein